MNKLNTYQKELEDAGFVRVDEVIVQLYDDEELLFVIPKPSDYPDKNFIAGRDFIFVFESKSDQTWYRRIDLTQYGAFRSSFFHIGYELAEDSGDEVKYGVNIQNTAFSLSFTIDQELFEIRKLKPDYEVDNADIFHSCESILAQLSGDISKKVGMFLKYLFSKNDDDLVPMPNEEFLKVFNAGVDKRKPLPLDLRNFYILVVLLAQREGKFPYRLSYPVFTILVTLPKPPMRFKESKK